MCSLVGEKATHTHLRMPVVKQVISPQASCLLDLSWNLLLQ